MRSPLFRSPSYRNIGLFGAGCIAFGIHAPDPGLAAVIDGSTSGDGYGEPLAVQTTGTGFGDNFSELNAAYGRVEGENLVIILTGNLEGNFNKLEIFIDSVPGGQNTIVAAGNATNDGWAARFDGFTFDPGFEADFLAIVRNGTTGGSRVLDIDFSVIGQAVGARVGRFTLPSPVRLAGPFTADNGIVVGFDNTNSAGVTDTSADPVAAAAVTTGLELSIPLSLIGNPTADVRVCAMINGSNHDFLSNQFLGGLPPGTANLGNNGSGGLSHVDLGNQEGEQFFVVPNDGGGGDPATVSSVQTSVDGIVISLTDSPTSVVQTNSVMLSVDGIDVTAQSEITRDEQAGITTVSYRPETRFTPGSTVAYAVSAQDQAGTDIARSGEFEVPLPLIDGDFPPGPVGGPGVWGVRQIWLVDTFTGGTIDGLDDALAAARAVAEPGFDGEFGDYEEPVLNHGSGGGIFSDEREYPAIGDGLPDDQFVTVAKGVVRFPVDGDYTIGVHSDDGFALRIVGAEFSSAHGAGQLDEVDRSVIAHPANTGDSNTRGILRDLPAGDYLIEFIAWEASGGDFFEVYAAGGAFENDAGTTTWQLIGFQPTLATVAVPGVDEAGWTVKTSPPGAPDLRNLFDAQVEIDAEIETTNHDAINFTDPESDGLNAGSIGNDVPFPRNTDQDDNDYAIQAEATLVVPRDGTYLIGFQGDDGSSLQVEGQLFEGIADNATGNGTGDGTDTIACDCLTGNNRTLGRITLAQGSYTIRALMFEATGGSNFEVIGVEEGSPQAFLIERDGARVLESEAGLQLVGDGALFQITGIEVGDGQVTLRWPGKAGQSFVLESSTNLREWSEVEDGITGEGPTIEYVLPLADPVPPNLSFRVTRE